MILNDKPRVNFAARSESFIAQAGAIVSLDAKSISTTFYCYDSTLFRIKFQFLFTII